MDRVDARASKYLESWNEQYGLVRDRDIVKWTAEAAMSDIEQWIYGQDPNESMVSAGVCDWSELEYRQLYSILAPSASYFGYLVKQELMSVTERGEFDKQTVTP